jgi:hypothetical protein
MLILNKKREHNENNPQHYTLPLYGKVREVMAYDQVVLLKTLRCGEYAQTTVCKPE